jgi:hypothetical protein
MSISMMVVEENSYYKICGSNVYKTYEIRYKVIVVIFLDEAKSTLTRELDTIVGRVKLPIMQVVIAYNPYGHHYFPKYMRDVMQANEKNPRDSILVEVPELESLEEALQDERPWNVLNPPPLIEQLISNFGRAEDNDLLENYNAALNSILEKGGSGFNPALLLLEWAQTQEGIRPWKLQDVKNKVSEKQDVSSKDAVPVISEIYPVLRELGATRAIKDEIGKLLRGNQVSEQTTNFLAEKVDIRFSAINPSKEQEYVLFVQRAVAKGLVSIENPESSAQIVYKGESLPEESVFKLAGTFARLSSNYGVAIVLERESERKLEPLGAVSLAELDSLPAGIRAAYKPLEEIVTDMIIMTQTAYNSISAIAKEKYGNYGKEGVRLIADKAARAAMPFHEYFELLFTSPDKGPSKRTGSALSQETIEDAAREILVEIKEKKAKAVTPVETLDIPIVFVSGAVRWLVENLPIEVVDALYFHSCIKKPPLGTLNRAYRTQVDIAIGEYQQLLEHVKTTLKNDFGLDFSKLPSYTQKFKADRVEATLTAYFGARE